MRTYSIYLKGERVVKVCAEDHQHGSRGLILKSGDADIGRFFNSDLVGWVRTEDYPSEPGETGLPTRPD
ncbi:MAG: hypothetical protein F4X40_02130 [Chloroflexi bacterium]|nr:hypothetical protein [Chloroflexota bacterium]